jgi:hypothetical protein
VSKGSSVSELCLRFFKRFNSGEIFCEFEVWLLAGPHPGIVLELPVKRLAVT